MTAVDAPAPARAAIRGSAITLVAYGLSTLVRIASNLIITRLLMPEQFGINALVTVVVTGLQLFSDIGIGANIIQSPRGEDPRFLNTAWTIQVLRGFLLWGIAVGLAWPLAHFYGRPPLLFLVPVAAIQAVIAGFESTRLYSLNRRMALGRISIIEMSSQITNITVMIGIAAITHSVWALVLGGIAAAVTRTSLSYAILPGERNRFAWEPEARQAVFEFGRWIFISTAVGFLASQGDRLVLGKLVSDANLGLYAIAANLAMLPSNIIELLGRRVLYPLVARSVREPDHNWRRLLAFRTRLLLALVPVIAMGIVIAPAVITIVLPAKYHEVGPLVSNLTIGTWLNALSVFYSIVLMASGAPKYMSLGSVAKTFLFASLVFVASPRFGVRGVAVLVSLTEVGFLLVAQVGCRHLGVIAWKIDLAMTLFGCVCCLAWWLLYRLVLQMSGRPVIATAAVVAATGVLVFALGRRIPERRSSLAAAAAP